MLYDARIPKGVSMARFVKSFVVLSVLLLTFSSRHLQTAMAGNPSAEGKEVIPVQFRNSGGVHFADDLFVLAGMVDSSGYSTAVKEKYQAYLLNEVTLEIDGQTLKPGAYGIGFLNAGKFVVMDLGANDVLQTASQHDAEMKRPVPLQVVASAKAGSYRLYAGRDYVEFRRVK